MKRFVFFTFFLLIVTFALNAKVVPEKIAKYVAVNYFNELMVSMEMETVDYNDFIISKSYANSGEKVIYIYNISKQGYIIVSGDDEVYPVLAYSYEGVFDDLELPPAVDEWITSYYNQIVYIRENNLKGDASIISKWNRYSVDPESFTVNSSKAVIVEPLLTCSWNQNTFYNSYCPADIDGPGGKALAGCVATAMGQVMYYYRYPQQGTGYHSFYHYDYGTQSANFGNTQYQWNEMSDEATYKNHDEVSKLLYHLAVSVDMNFSPTGSGAYSFDAANALKNYFGYSTNLSLKYKSSYSDNNWKNLLKANLDASKPMYYHGYGSGGHAFNVDGYQGTEHFHFNWGWSGLYNGYFYVSNLNPGNSSFTSGQGAITDIAPQTNYPYGCSGGETINGFVGTIEDGSGPIADYQNNNSCTWLIAPTALTNYIELSFIRFDTETGNDILEVFDGSDANAPSLGIFSGNTIPAKLVSTGNTLFVRFTTNSSSTSQGWLLNYEAFPPIFCTNLQLHTDPSGTISDGSGVHDYNNGSNCKWLIQPPSATSVTLLFNLFKIENNKDYLRVYDPTTTPGTLLGTYTGNSIPPAITSNSGQMMVIFFSDVTNNDEGWEASYTSTVGIDENSKNEIVVFPVPASIYIFLEKLPFDEDPFTVSLIDPSGRTIRIFENIEGQNATLPVSDIRNGTYFLRLVNNTTTCQYKVVIQK